jgi:small subunit ribosomal protein S16
LVKIRLKRMGTTKRPVYRLVVADSRSPRDGRFIESIGFYDPLPNPAVVRIDAERVQLWLKRGARPSDSARQLLVKEGILAARPFKITVRVEPVAEPAKASTNGGTAKAAKPTAADEPAAASESGATAETSVDEPASGAPAAGDVAGGSPEAISGEPRGGVPATAGPATTEPSPEATEAEGAEASAE